MSTKIDVFTNNMNLFDTIGRPTHRDHCAPRILAIGEISAAFLVNAHSLRKQFNSGRRERRIVGKTVLIHLQILFVRCSLILLSRSICLNDKGTVKCRPESHNVWKCLNLSSGKRNSDEVSQSSRPVLLPDSASLPLR